jgi:hypothetical protein
MSRRRRSGSLTTFAVMNFVIGGLLLCCAVCSGIDTTVTINNQDLTQQLKEFMNQEIPGYSVYKIGGAVLGFFLAVGLIVGSVGLLKVQSWGKLLTLTSAGVLVLHHVFMAILQLFFVNPAWDRFFSRFPVFAFNFSFFPKTLALVALLFQVLCVLYYLLQIIMVSLDRSFSAPARNEGDFDDEDDAPRRRRRRFEGDEDDYHEDDRPRRRRPVREDDDDDDRPRRRRPIHDDDD